MKRILILTTGYGEGHNSAARALAEAVNAEGGEGVVRDLLLETYGPTQKLVQQLYGQCINRAPKLWSLCYRMLDRLPLMGKVIEPSLYVLRRRLGEILAEMQPHAVVSVYPSYGYALDRLFPEGGAPFRRYMLVTDSLTINSIWHRCLSDYWIVPNEATAAVMRKAEVPPEKVLAMGFPVSLAFADAKAARPMPGGCEPLRVLYLVNHEPESAPAMIREMLELPFVELTVAGEKSPARRRAITRAASRPIELHGWTKRIPEFLMRSHVLIGKAGGAATQETIAARTPMIITKVVPGQEEGNARLIEESGSGAVCPTTADVIHALAGLHANGAAEWRRWHENISRISRPNAGREIARLVMG